MFVHTATSVQRECSNCNRSTIHRLSGKALNFTQMRRRVASHHQCFIRTIRISNGFLKTLNSWQRRPICKLGDHVIYSNSRLALELGEFAEQSGKGEAFRTAIFDSYFQRIQDMGEEVVLLDPCRRGRTHQRSRG